MIKRIKKIILSLVFTLTISLIPKTYAYWANQIIEAEETFFASITIGEWVTSYIPQILDGWNLNIWEDENTLNQNIPEGQLFTYDGFLYISLDSGYNPYWHGLPLDNSIPWAFVATDINWIPGVNYRVNSVVKRSGRYFIANHAYTADDWFVNDPLIYHGNIWSEWREIEPIADEHFGWLDGLNIIDYANPDWDYITYK